MGHTSNALLFQTCTHSRPPPRASAKYPPNKRGGASTSPESAAHVPGLRHGKLHHMVYKVQSASCLRWAIPTIPTGSSSFIPASNYNMSVFVVVVVVVVGVPFTVQRCCHANLCHARHVMHDSCCV